MKGSLKFLIFTLIVGWMVTFIQPETFKSVWESEKFFLSDVFVHPQNWFKTVIFWKWVVIAIAVLLVVISCIISIVRFKKARKAEKIEREERKAVKVQRKRSKKGDPVIHSNGLPQGNVGRFTRVNRNQK